MPEELPQPNIQEEITSVGFVPSSGKGKRIKIGLAILGLFLLLATIPAAIFLAKQRQEVRERAEAEHCFYCETIEGNPKQTHQCPGTIQDGVCKYDPAVTIPGSCTAVVECGDGVCDVCEGSDWCPEDCPEEGVTPTSSPACSQPSDCPAGQACHYGHCTPCGNFDEPTCWTHAVSCHWNAVAQGCEAGSGPTPPPGSCQIVCSAGRDGVSVRVAPGSESDCAGATVNVTWFASTCGGNSGYCGGASHPYSGSLPFTQGMQGNECGSWQAEVYATTSKGGSCTASNHGTDVCPTPPTYSYACDYAKVYNTSWNPITNLNTIQPGQTVRFAVLGVTTHPQGITKARIRINSGSWQETTNKKPATNEFYIEYIVPAAGGSFTIEAEVYNPVLGWK